MGKTQNVIAFLEFLDDELQNSPQTSIMNIYDDYCKIFNIAGCTFCNPEMKIYLSFPIFSIAKEYGQQKLKKNNRLVGKLTIRQCSNVNNDYDVVRRIRNSIAHDNFSINTKCYRFQDRRNSTQSFDFDVSIAIDEFPNLLLAILKIIIPK